MPKKKIRKCRFCGCTSHRACPGGCYWIAADVCSACEGRLIVEVENNFKNDNPNLFSTAAEGHYLENRIKKAFRAGWDAAKKHLNGIVNGNKQG